MKTMMIVVVILTITVTTTGIIIHGMSDIVITVITIIIADITMAIITTDLTITSPITTSLIMVAIIVTIVMFCLALIQAVPVWWYAINNKPGDMQSFTVIHRAFFLEFRPQVARIVYNEYALISVVGSYYHDKPCTSGIGGAK